MKGMFPQYEEPARKNYGAVWKEAIFILDANVLLNLYRYRENTRDELLQVLTKLADRIWIPFQVALEFQRNRLTVIAEQNKRFSEVAKAVTQSQSQLSSALDSLQLQQRHSKINPQKLIDGFRDLASNFLEELEILKKRSAKTNRN